MRSAREEAATRLSRELDRAVETFARQADAVFAERLAQVGDAGQQRLEQRLRQAQNAFERQREYPTGDLFGHITGFFSFTYGRTGVERS